MRIFRLLLSLVLCISLFSGCGGNTIVTDVDSEEELLSLMRKSGKYDFYDTSDIGTFSDLFCNVSEDEISDENKEIYAEESAAGVETSIETEYILNTSTKKFHLRKCSSVEKIKDKNLSEATNRDSILAAGYSPCKACNP